MQRNLEHPRKYRSGSQKLIKNLFKLCLTFSLFLSFIYTLLSWQPWLSWRQDKSLVLSGNLGDGHSYDRNKRQTFERHWCRLQKLRVDWEGLLSPCVGNTKWSETSPEWKNQPPTDPMASYIYYWDINPAGEFSRFFIQSQTNDGTRKTIGGDAWRIHISGPAYIAPNVIDLKNGSYEVLFLVMEPGVYQVEVMLDYTLCNGLRDPPADWFIKGETALTEDVHFYKFTFYCWNLYVNSPNKLFLHFLRLVTYLLRIITFERISQGLCNVM